MEKYRQVVVAKRLGYGLYYLDLLIQEQENRLCGRLSQKGLDGFLSIENQVNRDVGRRPVISRRKRSLL